MNNNNEPFVPPVKTLKGRRVVLDSDAALLYGVTLRQLRKGVIDNRGRFPEDFVVEYPIVPQSYGFGFTPEGLAMLAMVLEGPLAVNGSVNMVRAFVMLDRLAYGVGGPLAKVQN